MADAGTQPPDTRRSDPVSIRTPDQRLRVFISSTLQELADERHAAKNAITSLHLTPVMFELGARPHPPRDLYRAYLQQSHIFVGIYWQRYGWIAPGESHSGLEDEYLLARHHPKLIYVKTPAPQREPRLQNLLTRIRNDDHTSYKPFADARELLELLENDLALLLSERFEASLAPPPPPPAPVRSTIPTPTTSFIGRREVVRDALKLLRRSEVRLMTLLGPGGIGKSRLALELAARIGPSFRDGVVCVPLGTVTDPALVASAIAHTLGLREQSGRPLAEVLALALAPRQSLLLLDNFEQLLAAAPLVIDLLAAAPELKVLVTSRAPLRLSGEYEFLVPAMSLPDPSATPALAQLGRFGAIQLFVERARAIRPDFALRRDNVATIVQICRLLDGVPLAIELAAARLRVLSPQALLVRMSKPLALLTDGPRDLPARQRTLRATLDWSFDLLDEGEQRLFAQLAVFSGLSHLDAIETVCGPNDPTLLERLLALVDHSLVRWSEGSGDTRYGMLEIVHEYALEKLLASGQEDELRQRHAEVFLLLAERVRPERKGPKQDRWLEHLEFDTGNLRGALRWLIGHGCASEAMRLASSLRWFWMTRGRLAEGRTWLQQALALDGEVTPSVRAWALCSAGMLAWRQGELAAAHPLLEEALELSRRVDEQPLSAEALRMLGILLHNEGDFERSRRLLEESVGLFRLLGAQEGVANVLLSLGNVALDRGEPEARAYYQESRQISRRIGDLLGEAGALDNLGVVAWCDGDEDEAEALTLEVRELYRRLGSRSGLANASHRLGLVAFERGDDGGAREHFEEALAVKQELGEMRGAAFILYDLARVALRRGDADGAGRYLSEGLTTVRRQGARLLALLYLEGTAALLELRGLPEAGVHLLATATALREGLGVPVPPVNRGRHEALLERLRGALAAPAFDDAWREGWTWGLERALEGAQKGVALIRTPA